MTTNTRTQTILKVDGVEYTPRNERFAEALDFFVNDLHDGTDNWTAWTPVPQTDTDTLATELAALQAEAEEV